MATERVPIWHSFRQRWEDRIRRVLAPLTPSAEITALTPTPGDSDQTLRDKLVGALVVASEVDTTGPLYIAPATSKIGFGGAATVAPMDFWVNLISFGADDGASTSRARTANTNKDLNIVAADYANGVGVGFFRMSPTSTANTLVVGAASGGYKAATTLRFATATSANAVTSTTYGSINASGQWMLGANGSLFTRIRHGRATLVAGTVTVVDTYVTAASNILLTGQTDSGGPSSHGSLTVGTRVPGTSFIINSSNSNDTRIVAYVIIEP